MSADRELLELAAKAAGIEVTAIVANGIPHRFGGGYWNPLTDDGDRYRLARQLGMNVDFEHRTVSKCLPDGRLIKSYWGGEFGDEEHAVVGVAARIGLVAKFEG